MREALIFITAMNDTASSLRKFFHYFHWGSKSLWLVCLLWWLIAVTLVYRTGSVIVDGFQSIGSVSDSSRLGSLHWPLVGSFMGYDQTWGFHWVGWPLLRSLLLPLFMWNPFTEVVLACLMWVSAAWVLRHLVLASEETVAADWVGLILLVAPGFLIAAQSYRPEIPTALLLLLALRNWYVNSWQAILLRTMVMILLPLFHPLGLVVPCSWCCWDFLQNGRRVGLKSAFLTLIQQGWPVICGVLLLVLWFALQPSAWLQFQSNIQSQRLLTEGLGDGYWSVMRWGYGSVGAMPLILLLLGALAGSLYVLAEIWKSKSLTTQSRMRVLGAIAFLAALSFNLLAKNPNTIHLVSVLPFAAWMYVIAISVMSRGLLRRFRVTIILASLLVFSALACKNFYLLLRQQGQSYRAGLVHALESLPPSRKVLIPVAMWEAAQVRKGISETIYQFSTFPNILHREQRRIYEQQLLAEMEKGDLLVWDPLQESGGIFNFVEITALRHVLLKPQVETDWERLPDIQLPVRYSRNQSVNFEVYRKK